VAELIGNDQPVNLGALDCIETNLSHGFGVDGAAESLRCLMLDVLYDDPTMYGALVREFFPGETRVMDLVWCTRDKVTRQEFDAIDWVAMVHTVGDDDVISRYTGADA
jgi:hypothetical protein